jgi:hypothetical protein
VPEALEASGPVPPAAAAEDEAGTAAGAAGTAGPASGAAAAAGTGIKADVLLPDAAGATFLFLSSISRRLRSVLRAASTSWLKLSKRWFMSAYSRWSSSPSLKRSCLSPSLATSAGA